DEAGPKREIDQVRVQLEGGAGDGVVVVDDRRVAQGDGEDGDDGGQSAKSHRRRDGHHEIGEEEGRVEAAGDGDAAGDEQRVADGRDVAAGQPAGLARQDDDEQGQVV